MSAAEQAAVEAEQEGTLFVIAVLFRMRIERRKRRETGADFLVLLEGEETEGGIVAKLESQQVFQFGFKTLALQQGVYI